MKKNTAMIALGGNSLSPKSVAGSIKQQFRYTRDTMDGLSIFIESSYNVCITHGNGPQVGDVLHRMDLTSKQIPSLLLGVCCWNSR